MDEEADYLYGCVMSVITKVTSSSQLTDYVPAKHQYGKQVRIANVLRAGSEKLKEMSFRDDHWLEVEAAFSRLLSSPPSRQVGDCCRSLEELLARRNRYRKVIPQ
jgi:hypothetical protein